MTNQVTIPNIFAPSLSDSPWSMGPSWDSITIAGFTYGQLIAPGGRVLIHGAERFYKLDVKDPQGGNGATTTFRGTRPKPFTIEFLIWTDDQYVAIETKMIPFMMPIVQTGTALSVYAPLLARRNISAILVEGVGCVEPSNTSQPFDAPYRCVVRVREYLPPPPINVTITPQGQATTPPNPSPASVPVSPAVQALIDANNARRASLQGR
jgi:hypothetical protein